MGKPGNESSFTLATMIGWTTAIAIVLSALASVSFFAKVSVGEWPDANVAVLFAYFPAMLCWAGLWLALGEGWLVGRIVAMLLSSIAAVALKLVANGPWYFGLFVAVLPPLCLVVFRMAGYRISK